MGLRLRISLLITAMIVVWALVTARIVVEDMRSSIREETEAATRIAAQLMETVIAEVPPGAGPAQRRETVLASLRRLDRVRANEIRFYDGDGLLLYRSPPSAYRAADHAPAWFDRLMQPAIEPARLPLPGGAIVVAPDPSRSILEAWDDLRHFGWLALAFLVLLNAAVFWFLERSLRPLAKIHAGFAEMARGRFDVRLPEAPPAELAAISRGFNRMAQALGESLEQNRRLARAEAELEHNRRLAALVQAQLEDERRAIARELHDELGQCLTAIRSIAAAIAARAGNAAPDIRDHAKTIASVASRVYDAAHAIVRRLRPGGLERAGLAETLRDAVCECSRRHPELRCDLEISGSLEGLGEALDVAVYRVVQEALTNVVRHAEATRARVRVSREPAQARHADAVVLRIEDDGKGLQRGAERTRLGLRGMRERVQALGGRLDISGAPGEGVTVRAVLPVATNAAQAAQVEA